MKKKILYIMFCMSAGLSLFLPSCVDLDLPSDGRLQLEDIFSEYARTKAYYNQCYYRLSNADGIQTGGFVYEPTTLLASFSDEAQDASDGVVGNVNQWYNNAATAYMNPVGDPWGAYFQAIRVCNTFLTCMRDPTMATANIGADERNGWIAEVRVLRAYYYLQLIKRYGGVPIIETPYEIEHDFSQDVRATFEECADMIIAECDSALALPVTTSSSSTGFRWNVTNAESGIVTRGFAHAVRSQTALYAASPLWYKTGSKYTWAKAAEITKNALDECLAHGYELFKITPAPDVAQNAYEYYFNVVEPDASRSVDKETIFRSPRRMTVWSQAGTPMITGAVKAGACPSQELVDCYEMKATGLPPITGYSDAEHLQPVINSASGYDPANPYEGRDPRFYATIYFNGSPRSLAGAGASSSVQLPLSFTGTPNSMTITASSGEPTEYTLNTTASDPYVNTSQIGAEIPASATNRRLVFEYKSNKAISDMEFFFCTAGYAEGGKESGNTIVVPKADDWTEFVYDLEQPQLAGHTIDEWGWGSKATHSLRFDPTSDGGYELIIRNFRVEYDALTTPSVPVETFAGGNCALNSNPSETRYTRTGYYLRKFNNYRANPDLDIDGYMRVFRLGELYLNFAEAAYNASGADVAISGMSAREAVNAIRARASMPTLPAGLSKDDFETRYRNERRVELAFEEHRFFDVRRWKILDRTDAFVSGMNIITDSDGNCEYRRFKLKNRGTNAAKYLMYPINNAEVTKMLNYTGVNWQNEGW